AQGRGQLAVQMHGRDDPVHGAREGNQAGQPAEPEGAARAGPIEGKMEREQDDPCQPTQVEVGKAERIEDAGHAGENDLTQERSAHRRLPYRNDVPLASWRFLGRWRMIRPMKRGSWSVIVFLILWSASLALAEEPSARSEEHTSELQSRFDLVCRLLLEKKKKTI